MVHPLVLLSVADHHARAVSRGSTKRVVGILLGQDTGTTVNVANSFGIQKIQRNILAMQQNLKTIMDGPLEAELERAKKYYSLFSLAPAVRCFRMSSERLLTAIAATAGRHPSTSRIHLR